MGACSLVSSGAIHGEVGRCRRLRPFLSLPCWSWRAAAPPLPHRRPCSYGRGACSLVARPLRDGTPDGQHWRPRGRSGDSSSVWISTSAGSVIVQPCELSSGTFGPDERRKIGRASCRERV